MIINEDKKCMGQKKLKTKKECKNLISSSIIYKGFLISLRKTLYENGMINVDKKCTMGPKKLKSKKHCKNIVFCIIIYQGFLII